MTVTEGIEISLNQLRSSIGNFQKSLNNNIEDLKKLSKIQSKQNQKLMKWLIFWTGIMALAIIGQIITIIVTSLK